ncbi:MAG: lysylphosphatidylglycerol synthase transmembrane domain-containing protein [Gemmatimonadaceae bacterium]
MKNGIRGALGFILSALLLWWTMKDTSVPAVWDVLTKSNLPLWLACMVFATAIFPLRARRWQALLAPVYGRLPFRSLWQSTAIGMMATNVLPLRAGEFARAFALSRAEPQVKFTAAFASVAVDRLFDGTVVLLLMLLATLDPAFPSQQAIGDHTLAFYLKPTAIFLAVVLAGLVAFVVAPDRVFAISDAIMRRIAPRLEPKVRGMLEGFVSGLHVLRSPILIAEVFFWTVLHWLCNAFAFWLGFRAMGLGTPFSAGLLIQGLVAIGVSVPSTPGFFGPFEFFGKAGLAVYGVSSATAVGWVLGFHVLSFIPITIMGVWYLTRMKLHFRDFSGAAGAPTATA